MKFIDIYNIDQSHVFYEFEKSFANIIDTKYSVLSNINISIIDINHIDDIIKGNNLLERSFFADTPYTCDSDGHCIVDYCDNYGMPLTLSEKHSLIAHEIGHFYLKQMKMQFINRIDEEIEADSFACSIGFQSELKSALIKLENYVQNSVLRKEIGDRINAIPDVLQ